MSQCSSKLTCENEGNVCVGYQKSVDSGNTCEKFENLRIEDCTIGVMCSTLKKNKIMVMYKPNEETKIINKTEEIETKEVDSKDRNQILLACLDASLKDSNMGGHLCSRNLENTVNEDRAIATNMWQNNTSCAAEARTMLELHKTLIKLKASRKCKAIQVISYNKNLLNMLQKDKVTSVDLTKDAGDIIATIMQRKNEMNIEYEYVHCKGHVTNPECFETIPVEWMMYQYHEEVNKARIQVARNRESVTLKNPCVYSLMVDGKSNYRSINEVMRIMDARNEINTYLE